MLRLDRSQNVSLTILFISHNYNDIGDALLILHSYEPNRSSLLNRYAFRLVHEQENAEGAGGKPGARGAPRKASFLSEFGLPDHVNMTKLVPLRLSRGILMRSFEGRPGMYRFLESAQ